MAQVLCTGVNPALLTTRKFILERAAHTAVTATNEQELTAACEAHQFDVAVIGQGVSPAEKRRIASLVRDRCPGTKVLELYSPHTGKMVADADEWLVVPMDVPPDLAVRVTEMAVRNKERKKKPPEGGPCRS